MNNVDEVYDRAVRDVWDSLSGAMFNHLYHEDMAAHYDSVAFWLKIAAPTLIVLGVASAMIQAPPVEKSDDRKRRVRWNNAIAIILAIGGIICGAMMPDAKLTEHQILSKQWISVVDELQGIRSKLYAMSHTKEAVPPEMLAQIAILGQRSTALQQSEIDPKNDYYFQLAKVEARSRLYGSHVKTREDAIEEFNKQKSLGRIPGRNTADRKAPAPNAPIVPGAQSVSPAGRPASSVARAQ